MPLKGIGLYFLRGGGVGLCLVALAQYIEQVLPFVSLEILPPA